MRYRSLSDAMKERFGTKVYRLALTTGATCPNRDGTLGYGGCIFCSEGGSGEFAAPLLPVKEQIRQAKKRVSAKFSPSIPEEERKYIAYFQSFTNTYGDEDALLSMFREAAAEPGICAVAIGTRPDCLSEKMISGLSELNKEVLVWVELGLQTIHEDTARFIRRGYALPVFEDAAHRLKAAGLEVIVHIILGLPGETRERMLETVRYVGDFVPRLDGIKISLLYVLRGTDLADLYAAGQVPEMTLEEYAALIVDCLRILPEDMTVHRLTGDGPKKLLLSPLWSGDKKRVLNTLNRAIREAER
ncbi:MAG: TIGR01212 family radical SAM protein [Clostridium sp.]|nr:TIGR01212 family radical SAM protein [Clostridium sp.]MBP3215074.1 TIGR01212 family radical SAM protein [Clostridium sp.]